MNYLWILLIILIGVFITMNTEKNKEKEILFFDTTDKKYLLDVKNKYDNLILTEISKYYWYAINPEYLKNYVKATIMIESSFNENVKDSPANCYGLTQMSMGACQTVFNDCSYEKLHEVNYNIKASIKYINWIVTHYIRIEIGKSITANNLADNIVICYFDGVGNWEKYLKGNYTLQKLCLDYIEKMRKYLTPIN